MSSWEIFGIVALCIIGIVATVALVFSRTNTTPSEHLVSVVHNKYPETANANDQDILSIGNYTCETLSTGGTLTQAFEHEKGRYRYGIETDYSLIKFVMTEGVRQLCPQYISQTRGF